MKQFKKSEWFDFGSPIGEPEIKWDGDSYLIERLENPAGEVIWFGQGVNWVKKPGERWTVLGSDESVKENPDGTYPENRTIWIPCDPPIYEKMYQEKTK